MFPAYSRSVPGAGSDDRPTRRAALGSLLGCAAPYATRAQPSDKPRNVVLLICDQMRGDALGFLGSPNA
ncbi:MAG TPA: hypothetical protein VFQ41_08555, partial [Candidatus Angelobacter sp.]|nr:hypothetical protein [Candidatus Angelobacter sp.]